MPDNAHASLAWQGYAESAPDAPVMRLVHDFSRFTNELAQGIEVFVVDF